MDSEYMLRNKQNQEQVEERQRAAYRGRKTAERGGFAPGKPTDKPSADAHHSAGS